MANNRLGDAEIVAKREANELTAEDAARWLPETYSARIGTFVGASSQAVEETLSLHDLEDRHRLALVGAIEFTEPQTPEGVPRDFRLTDFCHEVLSACQMINPTAQEQN